MSAPTRNPHPLNHIGDRIVKKVGRTVITLQWIREDVYGVTTYQGTVRIGEHCKSWPTEDDARGHACMLAEYYNETKNYVWPCGCGDAGWIGTGLTWQPCAGCNPDGTNIPKPTEGSDGTG